MKINKPSAVIVHILWLHCFIACAGLWTKDFIFESLVPQLKIPSNSNNENKEPYLWQMPDQALY